MKHTIVRWRTALAVALVATYTSVGRIAVTTARKRRQQGNASWLIGITAG